MQFHRNSGNFAWLEKYLNKSSLLLLILAGFLVASCSNQENLELDALGTTIANTATAAASISGSEQELVSAQQTATQSAVALQETQAAQQSLDEASQSATATAFAPITSELPLYGVDPSQGHPGWIHPPLILELDGFHDYDFSNEFLGTVAQDFVVSADITWDTQYGGSGCGFVLRSDGNRDALNQYLVVATRAASGHVIFGVMSQGELVNGRDIYAYGEDPDFDWQNGSTNRLTVIGRGSQFDIYTNGTLIGSINPNEPLPLPRIPSPPIKPADVNDVAAMANYTRDLTEHETIVANIQANYQARVREAREAEKDFERGFVAMVALSQSGTVKCQFENAWLWLIE